MALPTVCKSYNVKSGCERGDDCPHLHVCMHFVQGDCKFAQCRRIHDIFAPQPLRILKKNKINTKRPIRFILAELRGHADPDDSTDKSSSYTTADDDTDDDDLVSETSTDLKTCNFYNGSTECKFGKRCHNLHLCYHFLIDDCKFDTKCRKSHNFLDEQPKRVLQNAGIDISQPHQSILNQIQALMKCKRSVSLPDSSRKKSLEKVKAGAQKSSIKPRTRSDSNTTDSELEICTFYLRGQCNYNELCKNHHSKNKLPYSWRYYCSREGKWIEYTKDCQLMIETAYCNPQRDYIQFSTKGPDKYTLGIEFDKMIWITGHDTGKVQRLSTKSSAGQPTHMRFLTEWRWYWRSNLEKFIEFGYSDAGLRLACITSKEIEEEYQSNPNSVITYQVDRFQYELVNMTQRNKSTGHVRPLRRRPALFDPEAIQGKRNTEPIVDKNDKQEASSARVRSALVIQDVIFPPTWSITSIRDNDFFQLVLLSHVGETAAEFGIIKKQFDKTMAGTRIKSITRIQNSDLWDAYYRRKLRMEKKAAASAGTGTAAGIQTTAANLVNEKFLFHGTKNSLIDAICQQGFDWRLSGTSHATAYGKGSYFAKDASYSKDFTDCRKLFFVRVLVGEYAKGNSSLVRPPPKNPNKPLGDLYDSCVDNILDPHKYVVFHNDQAYPEYIIEYC